MTKNTPYSVRDNETYGDLAAWLQATAATNDDQIARLKKNLQYAIEYDLTDKQRKYLVAYYFEGKKQREIAHEFGVNKSVVSRTISRAKKRLENCLRYSF